MNLLEKALLIPGVIRGIFHKHKYKLLERNIHTDIFKCKCGIIRDVTNERWWEPQFRENTEWYPKGYAPKVKAFIKEIEDLAIIRSQHKK